MRILKIIVIAIIFLSIYNVPLIGCSTFMLYNDNSLLIGHNLDENMEVPGIIFINKRGLEKESISFVELFEGVPDSLPKLKWISKYGSVTSAPFGRELIDGGLNEAGLYVGEMTMNQEHQYPVYADKPKIATPLWLQYLLDNYASIDEVVNNISTMTIECSFCSWHFFIADKNGNQAIIEFIKGKTIIYQNDEIPVKFLGNNQYAIDLDVLKQFKGYGGNKDIDLTDKSQDFRIAHTAQMLELNKANPAESDVNYAFDILKQLDNGNTKWSIVYDVNNMKMYYRTYKDTDVKHFAFSSFDFSCKEPVMMLDIHRDLTGDVAEYFVPYTRQANRANLEKLFMGIEGLNEMETLPEIIDRFADYPETVKCKK